MRLGLRALGLISTLNLVRLLAPADFGLIALATGFAQTIDGMMAIGADEAAIRERNATRDVYDTTFTLNLIRGSPSAVWSPPPGRPPIFFMNRGLGQCCCSWR